MIKDHNNLRLSQAASITKLAMIFTEEHLTDEKETGEKPVIKTARKV